MSLTVGISGLGQIGGSLARALKAHGIRVHAADPRVRRLGAVRSAKLLPPVDLLILACPMPEILNLLVQMRHWPHLPLAVTDVGSVKAPVVEALRRLPKEVAWIGGHPLAGTEGSGWASSNPDLFKGATWVLTREHRGSGITAKVGRLVRALGASPAFLTAKRHDRILARTSHAPYLVSCALVQAALADGIRPAELRRFSAGGWRDMTRLALSNPIMAKGYVLANRCEVATALRTVALKLRRLKPRPRRG